MKRFIIVMIAVMFLFSGFAMGQDCGKCPMKCKAKKTVKKADVKQVGDPIVFAGKGSTYYHTKECKAVNKETTKIKMSEALKQGLKPCGKCAAPAPAPSPAAKEPKKDKDPKPEKE